jgi:HTH-type transcriptional regulator / antitoxin MqsA
MKCPDCMMADLVSDVRDLPYTYKGKSTSIPMVQGDFCPACGETLLDTAESARVSAAMLEFNHQVDALIGFANPSVIVDPNFIVRVRKKLALDQQEAGALFGGGVNAFSRYETGKTKPPLALVKLLHLLDLYPHLLSEIRAFNLQP